eukprot:1820591-Pleurochrysis_carterae.AAC.2
MCPCLPRVAQLRLAQPRLVSDLDSVGGALMLLRATEREESRAEQQSARPSAAALNKSVAPPGWATRALLLSSAAALGLAASTRVLALAAGPFASVAAVPVASVPRFIEGVGAIGAFRIALLVRLAIELARGGILLRKDCAPAS